MKGFDTLSAAFRTLREEFRDLELAVVGTPLAGEGPRPEQTADGSGIIYHGSQNADGIKRLMAESLLLVLPSLQENSPLVIAEAAAMGLPSAATRVGGIPAMIEDGVTGFLLEPGSADCLTRTLHEALHNRPRLIQMGMAAQQRCLAEYSPHAVASKTITLYRQMLQEPERQ
jgi:glycosyltransferase involved in cell wall biosynthesis